MKKKAGKGGESGRRLPDSRQLDLLTGPWAPFEMPCSTAEATDFINPSPDDIYVGNVRLRAYLADRGLGHVLKLREFIFGSDLTPFLSGYSNLGRRAVHPGILLSLIMYGMMEGKWSLRDLEGLAVKDACAWWLCSGVQPDHSTIGNFINRFSEVLTEEYFISLTKSLVAELNLGLGSVSGDGTVIEAVSSRYRTIKKEAAAQALEQAKALAAEHPDDQARQSELGQAQSVLDEIFRREAFARENGQKKSPMVCPGEPEAVLQPLKNKSHRPSYKPCLLANSAQMIVGKNVQASDEGSSVAPMLAEYRAIFNRLPERALFDAGYCNYKVLSLCVELELDTLCPAGKGDREQFAKQGYSGKFSKSDFKYDAGRDGYLCPAGKLLRRESGFTRNGQSCVEYSCKECSGCVDRGKCTEAKKGRKIKRWSVDEYKEAMSEVFEHPGARKIYGQRKAMVEPVFSGIKQIQKLIRFHRRGLRGANLEFALHCEAHNLKKAAKLKIRAVLSVIFAENRAGFRLLCFFAFIFRAEE